MYVSFVIHDFADRHFNSEKKNYACDVRHSRFADCHFNSEKIKLYM